MHRIAEKTVLCIVAAHSREEEGLELLACDRHVGVTEPACVLK